MYIAKLDIQGPYMFGELDGLFRSILGTTATETELRYEDDFISGCYALAAARAEMLRGGTLYPIDAEYAFSIWCRWPLKPDVSAEFRGTVQNLRESVFGNGLDAYQLASAVPDSTLLLPFEGLYRLQAANAFDQLFPPAQGQVAEAGA